MDGQYSSVYSKLQSEIHTQYAAFHQANRDTIIAQLFQKIKQEFDQVFNHSQQVDLFRMKLRYNEGFSNLYYNASPQYNGNISGIEWQTPLDCAVKGYAYSYDQLNRLRQARYGEQTSAGGNWNQHLHAYDAQYSYDLNGNLLQLHRNKPNASGGYDIMDLLQYSSYDGNRLLSVNDLSNFPETVGLDQFLDGNNTAPDYSYDGAGNLIQDLNKDIGIHYNHLNKPTEVYELDSSSDRKVSYIYAADGTKLRQKVLDSNDIVTKRTDYAGSFQYEDPDGADTAQQRLSFIHHPKGRLLPDQGSLVYQYFLKDHLGNTRILFGDLDGDGKINPDPLVSNDVDQVADYYPFGLQHGASSVMATPAQNYLYNGKEVQDELGLGWLDYGARMYDASVARWNGVDALAEEYIEWSPFNYTLNNPVRFVDPDGNSVQRYESTFVDENGVVLDYRNDGDDNIYLVENVALWTAYGSPKLYLPVVGKEVPGRRYQIGETLDLTSKFDNRDGLFPQNGALTPVYPIENLIFSPPIFKFIKVGGQWILVQFERIGRSIIVKVPGRKAFTMSDEIFMKNLDEALEVMEKTLKNTEKMAAKTDLEEEIVLIYNRLHRFKRRINKGVLYTEEKLVESNKIRDWINGVIEELME